MRRKTDHLHIATPGNSRLHAQYARKILHHSPRRRESIVPLLQRPKKHSVIPAKAGIHRPTTPTPKKTLRHSREGGNPSSHYSNAQKNTPSFPRRRESIVPLPQRPKKHSVIPAKAEIHRPTTPTPKKTLRHSREGGNPSSHYSNAQKNTPSFPRRRESIVPLLQRPKNTPSFPRRRESIVPLPQRPKKLSVIPAKAGIHRPITPTPKKHSVIPAKAGIHRPITPTPKKTLRHSREGGNPSSHYSNAQKNTPSFPRRRESIVPLPQHPKKHSVIPAKAGIHRPTTPTPKKTLRHSREDGNPSSHYPNTQKNTPSFPRRRESIVPLPQRPKKHSVIPAKAGIHRPTTPTPKKTLRHSREGGNPQFPRTREFNENIIQTDQTHHFHTEPPQHHSREGRNSPPHYPNTQKNTPSFPRRRESTIPAHAGIQRKHHPD